MHLGRPKQTLSVIDAAAILVGVVIGAGIFRFPPLVAGNVDGPTVFMLVWLVGGIVSLIGALCYAELGSTYPDAGGEYHFLGRAFGAPPAFLFAWARMTVIQTGSIAIQAFVIGDYASELINFGAYSSSIYAAIVVVLLTGLNVMGLKQGKWAQNVLTACVVIALLSIALAGFVFADAPAAQPAADSGAAGAGTGGALGLAMVFVLLTFGGWNETSYLSAEIRGGRRRILHVLLLGIAIVTIVYLVINFALLRGLGFAGVAASQAVAADLLRESIGPAAAKFISVVIVIAALSTVNATILTGARTNYALGRDFPLFSPLGWWADEVDAPRTALVVQGVIAFALVVLGALTRRGIETMVDYTLPVFWVFFLLTGVSLFVLRYKDPSAERPFKVPLYPITPFLFCCVCGYMLYSSLAYTRVGALVGVGVLALGTPLMLLARPRQAGRRGFEPVISTSPAPAAGPEQV